MKKVGSEFFDDFILEDASKRNIIYNGSMYFVKIKPAALVTFPPQKDLLTVSM